MNSTVNPEVEMSNRVASLMGTTLTEADVHRFPGGRQSRWAVV